MTNFNHGAPRDVEPNDEATIDWLMSYKSSTRSTYRGAFVYFMQFTGKTGTEILNDRKKDTEKRWERKVLAFHQWMLQQPVKRVKGISYQQGTQSESSAAGATRVVMSFFSFYDKPLKFRSRAANLRRPRRKTDDYLFSRDELKKMADVANLKEKYVLIVGKSLGLRVGDFVRLTRENFEPYIKESERLHSEPPIQIGEIITGKENIPAHPFIDTDALPVVEAMLSEMARRGKTAPTDRLITFKTADSTGQILKKLAERACIDTGTKRVRFHCLRKFLIDRLANHMSESKWKQIVGKVCGETAYVTAEAREAYKRAMVDTTFSKLEEKDRDKFETLKMLAKALGITEEQMTLHFTKQKAVTLPAQIIVLEKIIESKGFADKITSNQHFEKEIVKDNCTDGKHCQRLVTEQELEGLLTQGWRIVMCLPSGRIVVSNE
jgi:integrase